MSWSRPIHEDIERCMAAGWTDGLPVIPPYATLVDRMVDAMGWKPTEIVGQLGQVEMDVRAEQLGATAVMAGCLPEYGPVLRALSQALLAPEHNISGTEVTTGGASTLVVVSGPIVRQLGMAHTANALGPNARAHATLGRFAAMVRHFCGGVGRTLDQHGTIGHPGRLSFCIAEHPETVWPRFHTQRGLEPDCSAVTIFATEGPISVNNHYATTGTIILETIADAIAHFGATSYYWWMAGLIVVLPPEHFRLVSSEYTREQAREYLYTHARRSTDELIRLGRLPTEPRPEARVVRGTSRSPLEREDRLLFIETGAEGGKFSAVIPEWVASHPVTRKVER
jgi:hypothetical protein